MNQEGLGLIAAIVTILCWTVGTFSFAHASQKEAPVSVNRVRLLYATILLSFIVCISERINPWQLIGSVQPQAILMFSISGFIGLSVGDYCSLTAYKFIGSRRTALFGAIAPAAALITEGLLSAFNINSIGIVGMIISMFGMALLAFSRNEKLSIKEQDRTLYTYGMWMAFLGAAGQGIGIAFARKGFDYTNISPFHAAWIRMFAATLIVYLSGVFKRSLVDEFKLITFQPKVFKIIMLGTIFGPVIGASFSLITARHLPAGEAQTVLSLLPISVTIISVYWFKEKINRISILALIIALLGVLLLIWRDKIGDIFA